MHARETRHMYQTQLERDAEYKERNEAQIRVILEEEICNQLHEDLRKELYDQVDTNIEIEHEVENALQRTYDGI